MILIEKAIFNIWSLSTPNNNRQNREGSKACVKPVQAQAIRKYDKVVPKCHSVIVHSSVIMNNIVSL